MTIAFVTCVEYPNISSSDQCCTDMLARKGFTVESAAWNNTEVNWKRYDLLVLRSCWDYYKSVEQFKSFLMRQNDHNIAVLNSTELVLWNHHKSYLLDIQKEDIQIPNTIIILKGSEIESFSSFLSSKGWNKDQQKIVIKPCVSASGVGVELTDRLEDESATKKLNDSLQKADMMIQEYVPEVVSGGELSCIFFNGVFSHVILKEVNTTKNDQEFRVNSQYGGMNRLIEVEPKLLPSVQKVIHWIITKFQEVPLYARVDGVVKNGEFVLMEVELIEPGLFLDLSPNGASQFTEAIISRIEKMEQRSIV